MFVYIIWLTYNSIYLIAGMELLASVPSGGSAPAASSDAAPAEG